MSALDIGIAIADLVAIALFILGLHDLNSPPTARRGNRLAMVGMFIALVAVLVQTLGVGWQAIVIGTVRRRRDRRLRGAQGQDDRDAADGRAVQRRGRRRGGADLDDRTVRASQQSAAAWTT